MRSFLAKAMFALATTLLMTQNAMAVIIRAFIDADTIPVGVRFPVYVSAEGDDGLPDPAASAETGYTISIEYGAALFATRDSQEPLKQSYYKKINPSGIDTLWAEFPLETTVSLLETTVNLSLNAKIDVGITDRRFTVFQPLISFAEVTSKDDNGNPLTWELTNHAPDETEDGSAYFLQTNTEVELALVAVNPLTMDICKECNFDVTLGANTSAGITAEDASFNNGFAVIRLKSEKDFVTEAASISVVLTRASQISATYGNMRFKDEPSSLPQAPLYKAPPMPATYTVMDLQGKILRKGITHSAEINMSMFAPGSYIVKIGSSYRKVNVR
jgi:hypothetical protein